MVYSDRRRNGIETKREKSHMKSTFDCLFRHNRRRRRLVRQHGCTFSASLVSSCLFRSVSIPLYLLLDTCICRCFCNPLLDIPESIDDAVSESRALPPNLEFALFSRPLPVAVVCPGLWNSSTTRISRTNCDRCGLWLIVASRLCLWWFIAWLWYLSCSCGGVLNARWKVTDSATVEAKEGL